MKIMKIQDLKEFCRYQDCKHIELAQDETKDDFERGLHAGESIAYNTIANLIELYIKGGE